MIKRFANMSPGFAFYSAIKTPAENRNKTGFRKPKSLRHTLKTGRSVTTKCFDPRLIAYVQQHGDV